MSPDEVQLQTVALTVGTAGHIDHGKTELVRFFTGCETDRLPEEKARGMTIDLGFATCELPNHRRVGIVDVPGHERFIHNMVAGAAGIDVVLLVVAADDGVMPQTIEHFHIVRLLGVSSGMVAITKTDLVAPERIEEVREQVQALIGDSFLQGCPIVPVSARTGAGFDAFYNSFVATVDKTAEHDTSGPFRMHVERAFVLEGLGTIVSGIPRSGKIRVGDPVELLPGGKQKKVRGLQVYGKTADVGRAGECVALKLSDLSRDEVGRGMTLAAPGHFAPARFVDARFFLLPELDKPIRPRTAVRFHVGTADVPGHLVLPELAPMRPGTESYVQVQLKRPVVAAPGDFFVLRSLSPVRTIGGGYVVRPDESKMRRSQGTWVEKIEEHERAFRRPESAVVYVLAATGGTPLGVDDISRQAVLSTEATRHYLKDLVESGGAVELPGERFLSAEAFNEACEDVIRTLNRLHDQQPLVMGFPKKQLFPLLQGSRHVCDRAVNALLEAGRVARIPLGYLIPGREPQLSPNKQALADKILGIYRDAAASTPRRDELPPLVGAPELVLNPIIDFLIQRGDLVSMATKVIMHRETLDRARALLEQHLSTHTEIDAGTFRNLLGTSRKYAIALLEYWDAQGVTRRIGDSRVLRG